MARVSEIDLSRIATHSASTGIRRQRLADAFQIHFHAGEILTNTLVKLPRYSSAFRVLNLLKPGVQLLQRFFGALPRLEFVVQQIIMKAQQE